MNNYYVIDQIVQAINFRKTIVFDYKEPNEANKTLRIGYPHAIYTHLTSRNILVDMYQTEGQSSNMMSLPTWKRFNIEYISNINIMNDRQFAVQSGYNPNSKNYLNVIAKI